MQIGPSVIVDVYNGLLDVAAAEHRLMEMGRDARLDKVLAVIRAFNMSEFVGLRLLHKHNVISQGEAMLESAVTDAEGFALVTRAADVSRGMSPGFVPNSWVLSDAHYVPMEFSDATLLADPDVNPASCPEFFAALAQAIRDEGLSLLIGPALIESALVRAHRPSSTSLMLEMTALDDRANVVRYVTDAEALVGTTTETFWTVSGEPEGTEESEQPEGDKPSPQVKRGCTRFCPYVQDPPVHQGTFIHQPG